VLDTSRRSFLRAALWVAAAPVIVRASSLMPVRALPSGEYLLGLATIRAEGTSVLYDLGDDVGPRMMGMDLRLIRDQLMPGLRSIEGKYSLVPPQWGKLFHA
jgi:hypothetical protein